MIEALLGILDPRWHAALEVAVHRPVRGLIDAVLTDVQSCDVVACEAQSELRRLEQQLGWSQEKSTALLHGPPCSRMGLGRHGYLASCSSARRRRAATSRGRSNGRWRLRTRRERAKPTLR